MNTEDPESAVTCLFRCGVCQLDFSQQDSCIEHLTSEHQTIQTEASSHSSHVESKSNWHSPVEQNKASSHSPIIQSKASSHSSVVVKKSELENNNKQSSPSVWRCLLCSLDFLSAESFHEHAQFVHSHLSFNSETLVIGDVNHYDPPDPPDQSDPHSNVAETIEVPATISPLDHSNNIASSHSNSGVSLETIGKVETCVGRVETCVLQSNSGDFVSSPHSLPSQPPAKKSRGYRIINVHFNNDKDAIFACKNCGEVFSSDLEVRAHIRQRHPQSNLKKYQRVGRAKTKLCEFCGEAIPLESIAFHVKNHGSDFTCLECGEKNSSISDLLKHMKDHQILKFSCSNCSFKTTSLEKLEEHQDTHDQDTHEELSNCDAAFSHENSFIVNDALADSAKHLPRKVSENDPNKEGLEDDVTATNEQTRNEDENNDLRIDESEFSCSFCSLAFTTAESLNLHNLLHTDIKADDDERYLCPVKDCGKTFTQSFNLTIHMRIHTGEKPYSCKTCDEKFRYRQQLKTHMMKHTGEKPYKCELCDKSYTQLSNLSVHKRKHTGDFPFLCSICGEGFFYKSGLITHSQNHTGEKPFKCILCQTRFTQASALTVHLKKRHEKEILTCKICGKIFTNDHNHSQHMKLKHSDSIGLDLSDRGQRSTSGTVAAQTVQRSTSGTTTKQRSTSGTISGTTVQRPTIATSILQRSTSGAVIVQRRSTDKSPSSTAWVQPKIVLQLSLPRKFTVYKRKLNLDQ